MNYIGINNLSLKYQRLTSLVGKDRRIKTFELVAKSLFHFQHSSSRRWDISERHFINEYFIDTTFYR